MPNSSQTALLSCSWTKLLPKEPITPFCPSLHCRVTEFPQVVGFPQSQVAAAPLPTLRVSLSTESCPIPCTSCLPGNGWSGKRKWESCLHCQNVTGHGANCSSWTQSHLGPKTCPLDLIHLWYECCSKLHVSYYGKMVILPFCSLGFLLEIKEINVPFLHLVIWATYLPPFFQTKFKVIRHHETLLKTKSPILCKMLYIRITLLREYGTSAVHVCHCWRIADCCIFVALTDPWVSLPSVYFWNFSCSLF